MFAQIFGAIALIIDLTAIQMKKKHQILFLSVTSFFFFSISFALLKAYSGALVSLLACLQTLVAYYYDKEKEEMPRLLIYFYLFITLVCGLFVYSSLIDVLPILCALLYVITIVQKTEKNIRKIVLYTMIIWITYDAIVGAYMVMLSDSIYLFSTIIAIYRYDVLRKPNLAKAKEGNKQNLSI